MGHGHDPYVSLLKLFLESLEQGPATARDDEASALIGKAPHGGTADTRASACNHHYLVLQLGLPRATPGARRRGALARPR